MVTRLPKGLVANKTFYYIIKFEFVFCIFTFCYVTQLFLSYLVAMSNVSVNLGFFITLDLQIQFLETKHNVLQQLQVFIVITNDRKTNINKFSSLTYSLF